jgi:hypothetical protein
MKIALNVHRLAMLRVMASRSSGDMPLLPKTELIV